MEEARWISGAVGSENGPAEAGALSRLVAPQPAILFREQPAPARGPTGAGLTLMSANLLHDWPRLKDQEARLEAVARMVERDQVDIALFQEVGRDRSLRVAEWLGARLPMAYAYGRVNGDLEALGMEEGLAIFSRFALARPALEPLTRTTGLFRRCALGAVALTPWEEVGVYNAHFSLRPWRNRRQPAILRAWVEHTAGDRTAFIGGDFNSGESSSGIRRLQSAWLDAFRAVHPDADGTTHEIKTPFGAIRRRLDYLFLRTGSQPWRVVEARHLMAPELPHSDHLAVIARFEPAPERPTEASAAS